MQVLTLIRGLPGSGKSTLAKALCRLQKPYMIKHYEADMFFINTFSEYCYDPTQIKQAHAWCQKEVREALENDMGVVVSNTFTQHWEMQPYKDMAKEFGVPVQVITVKGDFINIHGVPHEVIKGMRERWED